MGRWGGGPPQRPIGRRESLWPTGARHVDLHHIDPARHLSVLPWRSCWPHMNGGLTGLEYGLEPGPGWSVAAHLARQPGPREGLYESSGH